MSEAEIYVEGGGESKELIIRCREGFHKLLKKCGFSGRQPKIRPCGSRNAAYDNFKTAHAQKKIVYVALLVDSEDPVADADKPWEHLQVRDGWLCPPGAADDQVFLMTTCMETWIVADRSGLKRYFERHGKCIRINSLPSFANLEMRDRHDVQDALVTATKDCLNFYAKNKRSFEALANADPAILGTLPAFSRMTRILDEKL